MTRRWLAPVVALALGLAAAPVAGEASDPVRRARAAFDAGEHAEGLRLLTAARRESRRAPAEHAQVLSALAEFYGERAGDRRREERYLERVVDLELPADQPLVAAAAARLDEIAGEKERFAEGDALLARVRTVGAGATPAENVAALERLLAERPDYPRRAAARYYLGAELMRLERFREAVGEIDRAIALAPALGFSLPAPSRREEAFERWWRGDLSAASHTVLGIFLAAGFALFFAARPWQWLGLRHALALGALALAWWGAYHLLARAAGAGVSLALGDFPAPAIAATAPGSPHSGALDRLFWYGLAGTGGVFVLALAAGRLGRFTRAFAVSTAALALFAALLTDFTLRIEGAEYRPGPEGRYRHLAGALYFPLLADQEPFLLTDPLRYCAFQDKRGDMDEPAVREWFARYADLCEGRE